MDRYDQECKHQFPLGDWPTVAKMMRRAHAEGEKEAEQALAEAQDKLEAAKVSYAKETHDRIEAEAKLAAAQREHESDLTRAEQAMELFTGEKSRADALEARMQDIVDAAKRVEAEVLARMTTADHELRKALKALSAQSKEGA